MKNNRLKLAYDELVSAWDKAVKENPFYRNVRAVEDQMIERWIPVTREKGKALDIGCGTGDHTLTLLKKGYQVTAIDISSKMLAVAERRLADQFKKTVKFRKMRAEEIDFSLEEFKVIVSLGSVINHFQSWDKFFKKINEAIEKEGIFIFCLDNLLGIDSFMATIDELISGLGVLTVKELIKALKFSLKGQYYAEVWNYKVDHQLLPVSLFFLPLWKVKKLLRQNNFCIKEIKGSNIFSSFSPQLVRAGWDLGIKTNENSGWESLLRKIDLKVGKQLYFLGAQTVIVSKKN